MSSVVTTTVRNKLLNGTVQIINLYYKLTLFIVTRTDMKLANVGVRSTQSQRSTNEICSYRSFVNRQKRKYKKLARVAAPFTLGVARAKLSFFRIKINDFARGVLVRECHRTQEPAFHFASIGTWVMKVNITNRVI